MKISITVLGLDASYEDRIANRQIMLSVVNFFTSIYVMTECNLVENSRKKYEEHLKLNERLCSAGTLNEYLYYNFGWT